MDELRQKIADLEKNLDDKDIADKQHLEQIRTKESEVILNQVNGRAPKCSLLVGYFSQ